MNVPSIVLIWMIKVYRSVFSYGKPCCRFIPSCSEYAIGAIRKYGAKKGTLLAWCRIVRCRPSFHSDRNWGYDPVP